MPAFEGNLLTQQHKICSYTLLRAVVRQVHYTTAIQQLFCVLIKITRQLFTKGDGRNKMERMVRLEEQNGLGRKYNE